MIKRLLVIITMIFCFTVNGYSEITKDNIIANTNFNKFKGNELELELSYPNIFGGNNEIPDFWQTIWIGQFYLGLNYNHFLNNKVKIGVHFDFSSFGLKDAESRGSNFYNDNLSIYFGRELNIAKNNSILLIPFIRLGGFLNSFYYQNDTIYSWHNDIGISISPGLQLSFALSKRIKIGPIISYNFSDRIYNLTKSKAFNQQYDITIIQFIYLGINLSYEFN